MVDAKKLAADIMDAYYQDYASENDFFELDYFIRQVNYEYAAILDEKYERLRQELRADRAHHELMISFDESWLVREAHEIKGDTKSIKLKQNIYAFPFTHNNVGVQDIVPLNDSDCILTRTTEGALWTSRYDPRNQKVTKWFVCGPDEICVRSSCGVGKVNVLYLPAVSEDLKISDGMAAMVRNRVWVFMTQAKTGIVNETNDDNTNKTIQTESNQDQVK